MTVKGLGFRQAPRTSPSYPEDRQHGFTLSVTYGNGRDEDNFVYVETLLAGQYLTYT